MKRQAGKTGDSRQTNGWDALIRLIDTVNDLVQSGNLVALIILAIIGLAFFSVHKIPDAEMAGVLKGFGAFLKSESFYLLPLSTILTISVIANVLQARVYRKHIQDLTEQRKQLMHGLEDGSLKPLRTHRTSHFDIQTEARSRRD